LNKGDSNFGELFDVCQYHLKEDFLLQEFLQGS